MEGLSGHTPVLCLCRGCGAKVVAHVPEGAEVPKGTLCPKCGDNTIRQVVAEWDKRRAAGVDQFVLVNVKGGIRTRLLRQFIDNNWRRLAMSYRNREKALDALLIGDYPILITMKEYDLFGRDIRGGKK